MDGQREDRGVNSQPSQHFNTACLLNYRHLSFFWGVTPNPFTNILLQKSCLSSKVSIACLVLAYLLDPLIHSQAVNQEGWLSVFFFIKRVQNVLIFFARQNFKRLTKLINNHFFFFYIAVTFLMQCVANVHTALYLSQESGSWENTTLLTMKKQAHAEHYKTGNTIIRSLKRTPNKMAFPWYIAVLLEEN